MKKHEDAKTQELFFLFVIFGKSIANHKLLVLTSVFDQILLFCGCIFCIVNYKTINKMKIEICRGE